jgi:hypothetical protein
MFFLLHLQRVMAMHHRYVERLLKGVFSRAESIAVDRLKNGSFRSKELTRHLEI